MSLPTFDDKYLIFKNFLEFPYFQIKKKISDSFLGKIFANIKEEAKDEVESEIQDGEEFPVDLYQLSEWCQGYSISDILLFCQKALNTTFHLSSNPSPPHSPSPSSSFSLSSSPSHSSSSPFSSLKLNFTPLDIDILDKIRSSMVPSGLRLFSGGSSGFSSDSNSGNSIGNLSKIESMFRTQKTKVNWDDVGGLEEVKVIKKIGK